MKCLTIHQPWADLIVCGIKPIENRCWQTPYRGDLYIHSSREMRGLDDRFLQAGAITAKTGDVDYPHGNLSEDGKHSFVHGAIIGVVRLVDIVPASERPDCPWTVHTEGNYAWILADAISFPPVCCPGRQRIWEPDPARQQAVHDLARRKTTPANATSSGGC